MKNDWTERIDQLERENSDMDVNIRKLEKENAELKKYKQRVEEFKKEWNRKTDDYIFHNKKIDKKEIKRLDDLIFNILL